MNNKRLIKWLSFLLVVVGFIMPFYMWFTNSFTPQKGLAFISMLLLAIWLQGENK